MSDPTPKREHILILAFSPVAGDARVLRQAKYLSEKFRVTVAGFGENPFSDDPHAPADLRWHEIGRKGTVARGAGLRRLIAANLCRLSSKFLPWYYGTFPHWRYGWHMAHAARYRVIYCNDVDTLPIGVAAAMANRSTKVILDLHEYATREVEEGPHWTWERKPVVTRALKSLSRLAHGTVTVAESFAPLMRKEFGMKKPVVVHNAPDLVPLPPRTVRADGSVHLVHHGLARPLRRIELMIEALALADKKFVLHFMLTGDDEEYQGFLRREAARLAPGRVFFEPTVPPAEIVPHIARYDIGVFLLPPVVFNYEHAMPNKFFDFIGAGLGVAVAPSPNMAGLTRENGIGWVARDYTPRAFAEMLDAISPSELESAREASMKMRETFNASTEMARLIQLVERVAERKARQPDTSQPSVS